jgi:antitoxin MazE
MQIARWGNSLAVRLPAAVVEVLDLKPGDTVEIDVAGAHRFEVRRADDVAAVLRRLRRLRGRVPADFRFDRLEANVRR